MRQHKILTRTLLILSIINFAFAAPAAVRERAEVRLDANVTRNMTAASQKRADPSDEGGSTSVPGPDHAPPPSLDSTNWEKLMQMFGMAGRHRNTGSPPSSLNGPGSLAGSDHVPPSLDSTNWEALMRVVEMAGQHRNTGTPPPSQDSPGVFTGSDHVPPSPGLPTGSRLPVGSMPAASSLSPPPPESGSTNVPGPDRAPPPSLDSTSWEELMRISGMAGQHKNMPPPSFHGPGSLTGSDYVPPSLDSTNWEELMRTFGTAGQHRYTGGPLPSPDGSGLLTESDHVSPSPGLPTGSRLPAGPMSVTSSLLPPPPESGSANVPGPDHAPLPNLDSTSWEEFMRIYGMAGQHRNTGSPPPSLHGPGSLTGSGYVPPSLDSTNWEELMRTFGTAGQHRYTGGPLPSPDGPGLLTGSDHVSQSPGLPTGSLLPAGPMPVASSLSPPPPERGSTWPGHGPPPSLYSTSWEELMRIYGVAGQHRNTGSPPPSLHGPGSLTGSHYVPPSLDSTNWEELMRMFGMAGQHGSTGGPLPSLDTPGLFTASDHVPPSSGSPTGSRLPVAGSLSPPAPPLPQPTQPGPSENRFPIPPGFSVGPDTLSSTGNQPTPPQSQGVDPETHSRLRPEPLSTEFWEDFMKGKIKRRISDSDTANLAQRNPRSRIF